jgi:hypothetical protein
VEAIEDFHPGGEDAFPDSAGKRTTFQSFGSGLDRCCTGEDQYSGAIGLRRETPEEWLEIARECGEIEEPRPGKQVWWGA